MGHFCRERLPSPRAFYERELDGVTRRRPNHQGWVSACCPFCKSKTAFRATLETGVFCCFRCDVRGGDVLDFVRVRDGIDFKRAAKQLDAWSESGLSASERDAIKCQQLLRQKQIHHRAELKRRRLALRDDIHMISSFDREANGRLCQIRGGVLGEVYPSEEEDQWMLMAEALERLRVLEITYGRLCEEEVA